MSSSPKLPATMKGVWLENKKISFRDNLPRQFPDGEVVVKMLRSGICNTDLELIRGYYPYTGVLGHEFVGLVVSPESSDICGKRVVGEINCVCNTCRFCTQGLCIVYVYIAVVHMTTTFVSCLSFCNTCL